MSPEDRRSLGIWTGDRGNVAGRPGCSDGQGLAQPSPATWNAPEWTFRALFQRVGGIAFPRSRGRRQDAVLSTSQRASDMRSAAPFAGVLSQPERLNIIEATSEAYRRTARLMELPP